MRTALTATAIGVALVAGHGFIGLLAVLVYVWASSMLTTTTSTAKVRSLENRLGLQITATAPAINLVANGGAIGGNVTVNGSHTINGTQTITGDNHIAGTLYGTGGTLTVGDNLATPLALTASGTITSHGAFRGASTTGVGGQGSILGDEYTTARPGGAAWNNSAAAAYLDGFQAAFNAHVSDTQATVNRVNDLLSALG